MSARCVRRRPCTAGSGRGKGAHEHCKEPLHPLKTARSRAGRSAVPCWAASGRLGGPLVRRAVRHHAIDAVVLQNQLTDDRSGHRYIRLHNMAQFENSNDFYGVKIPFTTKSFITYDGTIKAGVDPSEVLHQRR